MLLYRERLPWLKCRLAPVGAAGWSETAASRVRSWLSHHGAALHCAHTPTSPYHSLLRPNANLSQKGNKALLLSLQIHKDMFLSVDSSTAPYTNSSQTDSHTIFQINAKYFLQYNATRGHSSQTSFAKYPIVYILFASDLILTCLHVPHCLPLRHSEALL